MPMVLGKFLLPSLVEYEVHYLLGTERIMVSSRIINVYGEDAAVRAAAWNMFKEHRPVWVKNLAVKHGWLPLKLHVENSVAHYEKVTNAGGQPFSG